jgi:uncharacterized protein Smg (DUF494 family)
MHKEPDVNVLIDLLKDFDYSDPKESYQKLKKQLEDTGFSTDDLYKALFGQ